MAAPSLKAGAAIVYYSSIKIQGASRDKNVISCFYRILIFV